MPPVEVALAVINARFAMHHGHIVLLLGLFTRPEKDVSREMDAMGVTSVAGFADGRRTSPLRAFSPRRTLFSVRGLLFPHSRELFSCGARLSEQGPEAAVPPRSRGRREEHLPCRPNIRRRSSISTCPRRSRSGTTRNGARRIPYSCGRSDALSASRFESSGPTVPS